MSAKRRPSVRRWTLIAMVFVIGLALRLYRFPHVPSGLNQDEISSTYESYSLSKRVQTAGDITYRSTSSDGARDRTFSNPIWTFLPWHYSG